MRNQRQKIFNPIPLELRKEYLSILGIVFRFVVLRYVALPPTEILPHNEIAIIEKSS